MSDVIVRPQINTLTDKLDFALTAAALTGIGAAVFSISIPVFVGISVFVSSVVVLTSPVSQDLSIRANKLPPVVGDFSSSGAHLPGVIEKFAQATGVKGRIPLCRCGVIKNRLERDTEEYPEAYMTGMFSKIIVINKAETDRLTPEQQTAVAGHEYGHVASGYIEKDILISGLAVTDLVGIFGVSLLAFVGDPEKTGIPTDRPEILVPLIALAAATLYLWRRFVKEGEYQADRISAEMTRNPEALASMLEKSLTVPDEKPASSSALSQAIDYLIDRHPPLPDRIARLRKMAKSQNEAFAPAPAR